MNGTFDPFNDDHTYFSNALLWFFYGKCDLEIDDFCSEGHWNWWLAKIGKIFSNQMSIQTTKKLNF